MFGSAAGQRFMLGVITWCTFLHAPSLVTAGYWHYPPSRASLHLIYCHDFLISGLITMVAGMPTSNSCLHHGGQPSDGKAQSVAPPAGTQASTAAAAAAAAVSYRNICHCQHHQHSGPPSTATVAVNNATTSKRGQRAAHATAIGRGCRRAALRVPLRVHRF